MKNYKNNYKRNRFRSNGDRNFKRNGSHQKINVDFSNGSDFKRKNPGRNNQNASKLIEKYTDLAREALSKGDKILSENYFQHADHFIRIQDEKEKSRIAQNDNSGKTSSEDHDKLEDQKSTEKTATSN